MKRLDTHLYAITVLTETAGFLVVFAISRALAERGASMTMMGFVGAAYAFAYGVMSIIGGRQADRKDNSVQLMRGAALMASASAVVIMLMPGNGWSILPYAVVGAGQALIYTAVIAWMSRAFGHKTGRTGISRSLIMFSLAWNIGMIAGQGGGGWLYRIDARWPVAAAVALSLLNIAMAYHTRHTTAEAIDDTVLPAPDAAAKQQLSAAFMKIGWLANLGGTFCIGIIFHLLPNVFVEIGVSSDHHGLMLATMRCVVIAMYVLMYATRFWHHRLSTSLLAQGCGIAGMLLIAMAQSGTMLTAGLVMMGLVGGYNYFASLYYSTTGTQHDQRGAAGGIHEATLALGIGIGTIVGGVAGQFGGSRAPYVMGAIVIATVAVLQMVMFVRRAQPAAATEAGATCETPTSSES